MPTKIQLSVEESIDFARYSARLDGIVLGVQIMAEQLKRERILELSQKPKTQPQAPQKAPQILEDLAV